MNQTPEKIIRTKKKTTKWQYTAIHTVIKINCDTAHEGWVSYFSITTTPHSTRERVTFTVW